MLENVDKSESVLKVLELVAISWLTLPQLNVKLSSLWTVTLVFQQFPLHGRLEPWLLRNIIINFLSSEGDT